MAAALAQTLAAARRELVAAGFAQGDAEACLALTRPALFFEPMEAVVEEDIPLGASKIGGRPDLPDGFAWPQGAPFLVQLNLADIPEGVLDIALPREGLLSCFWDGRDWDNDAVLLWTQPGAALARRAPSDSRKRYEPRRLAARIILTLDLDRPDLPAVADDEIFDVIDDWSVPENGVQLGGNRKIIQHGEAPGMHLVLQIGSIEEVGMMWGDLGCLTLSMRSGDILDRRFDRIRTELQCY